MNPERIEAIFLARLKAIAPEVSLETLQSEVRLRDQCTFDSVDFLDLAMALEKELGIAIPEGDYPHLSTLKGAVAYLTGRIADKGRLGDGGQGQPR